MAALRTQPSPQRDLLNLPVVGRFLRWKHARTSLQAVLLVLSALILYDGFWGPQLAPKNLAGVLPWVHWRGFVVLALLIAGNIFCMACPFMLPRRLAKKLLPANRSWPKLMRNKWLAIGVLLVFFWAYEAYDLWASPWLTAWVALTYFVAAFAIDGIFQGAAFCKYVCPIGQFHFVHGMVSPLEVKVRQPDICGACPTKDCIKGRYEQRRERDVERNSQETTPIQETLSPTVSGWNAKSHPHPDPLPQGRGGLSSLDQGNAGLGKAGVSTRENAGSESDIRHSRESAVGKPMNPGDGGVGGETAEQRLLRHSGESAVGKPMNPDDQDENWNTQEQRELRHSRESSESMNPDDRKLEHTRAARTPSFPRNKARNPFSSELQPQSGMPDIPRSSLQPARDVATPAGLQLVQTGCELWLFQERKVGNMDCTFCLDCIQACPYDNVGIQLRAPTSEFKKLGQWHSGVGALTQRTDLAALVIVLVFAAFVNAFGMVPPVYALELWLATQLGVTSEPVVLGVLFIVGLVALPFALVAAAAWASRALAGSTESLAATATRFSYALVPIGFGMWLAHYGFHFLIGALTAVPVTQSFLADFGVPLLGDPRWDLAAIVPNAWLVPLELVLLELGMLVSLTVGYRLARQEQDSAGRAARALLPWAVLIVALFFAGAWMMTQPMEMRGTILG